MQGFHPEVAQFYSGLKRDRELAVQNLHNIGASEVARIQHPEFLQKSQAGAWDAEAGYKNAQGKILVPAQANAYNADAGYRNQQTAGLKQALNGLRKIDPHLRR